MHILIRKIIAQKNGEIRGGGDGRSVNPGGTFHPHDRFYGDRPKMLTRFIEQPYREAGNSLAWRGSNQSRGK
jgi:hypothetical protein